MTAYLVMSVAYSALGRALARLVMLVATAVILSSLMLSAHGADDDREVTGRTDTLTIYR